MNSGYFNFDLLVIKTGKYYRAILVNSPAGQGSHQFEFPFSDLEDYAFQLKSLLRNHNRSIEIETTTSRSIQDFGAKLYNLIFDGEVGDRFLVSLAVAEKDKKKLRIRLNLSEAPRLINIPWELLYNTETNSFISLSNNTPIIRKLDLPVVTSSKKAIDTLKVLVMISDPKDQSRLDVKKEWQLINRATKRLQDRNSISLVLIQPSLAALQRQLQLDDYHIFHFIGHGSFDSSSDTGMLIFEDEENMADTVNADFLGTVLHDENSIQLAVLNSCSGGKTSIDHEFSGSGQSLLKSGIQNVISMQFDITDKAAIIFSEVFYSSLVGGYSPDSAVSEARKSIYTRTNTIDWAAPVYYSSMEKENLTWELHKDKKNMVNLNENKIGCASFFIIIGSLFLMIWIFYFIRIF